jgi:hypothetical protein
VTGRVLGGDHAALTDTVRARALLAWSSVHGTVSFELLVGSVAHLDRYFDRAMTELGRLLGL